MSTVYTANVWSDTAGNSRVGFITSSNSFYIKTGSDILTVNDRISITGNLIANSDLTVLSGNNQQSSRIEASGGTVVTGTANITGTLSSNSNITVTGNNISVASNTSITQNGKVLNTWTFINTQTFSATANLFSPNLSGWKMLRITISNFTVATGSVNNTTINWFLSADNCATFNAGTGNYIVHNGNETFTSTGGSTSGLQVFRNTGGNGPYNIAAAGGCDCQITILNWSAASNVIYYNENVFSEFTPPDIEGSTIIGVLPGGPFNSGKLCFLTGGTTANTMSGTIYYEGHL